MAVGVQLSCAGGTDPVTGAGDHDDLGHADLLPELWWGGGCGRAQRWTTFSHGRFVLGLGSQIKPHIERRFAMPWSSPDARMREFVLAMRAIWASWQDGEQLNFRGEFYHHTLMTPFFAPPAHEWGRRRCTSPESAR